MEHSNSKRKNVGRFGLVLFVLLAANIAYCSSLKTVYDSQIGVRELTGNNDGSEVEAYLAYAGHKKGAPWCAAFVGWCHAQAGVNAPRSAWSPDWFKTNVVYRRDWRKDYPPPEPGMVFGLWFQNLGRVAHVGFIDGGDSKSYITVEGNTNGAGSREGDGVCRKKRLKSSIYIISKYNEKNICKN